LTDNRQGITEKVTLNNAELTGWKMYKFPFSTVSGYNYGANKSTNELQPGLYKGAFTLAKTADTWLDMRDFGKGFVFLNGHNLGKYWYIGPQQTLYVPASWLKKGLNQIKE
jgi:beta-galactosidase